MARIRQVRDVLWRRRREEERRRLELEETKLRTLATAIHGAAGNKDGVRAAGRIKLFDRPPEMPSTKAVLGAIGADPVLGLITPEQILAEQVRLGLVSHG